MSEHIDWTSQVIEGRRRRIEFLFTVIEGNPGLDSDYYQGKYTRAYSVKERTFLSYLSTLIKQGRVIRTFDSSETTPIYWTQETWAMQMEARKQKEAERMRSLNGKMEEYVEASTK